MKDLPIHLALLLAIGVAIAGTSALYSEPDDRKALRSVPRRLATFLLGITWLPAILLLIFQIAFSGSFSFVKANASLIASVTLYCLLMVIVIALTVVQFRFVERQVQY